MRLHLALLCVVAALCALAAHAAPVPLPREHARAAAFADVLRTLAPQPGAGPCATRVEAAAELLIERATRPEAARLATTLSGDAGEIAVLEDDGTFFYSNAGGQSNFDLASGCRAFYETHGDDYDFLVFYLASGTSQWLGSPGALAAAWPLRNDTDGIGLDRYDLGPWFWSPSRLQTVMTMNGLHRYPADPDVSIGGGDDTFSTMDVLAHEFAHRWLAYTFVDSAGTTSPALLGRDWQHWSFFADVDGSFMEGCDWTQAGPDSFRTTGVSSAFGRLDQYLMGLRTRAEMDSVFVVNAPEAFDPPGTYIPISVPAVGVGCRGRATWWKVDDIERVHGPRVPDGAVAPRHWRVGFVLVTPHGVAATPADLAKLDLIRTRFPLTIAQSTEGRGSVDVSLDSRAGHVSIAHTPPGDTEDTITPRTLGCRVRMSGGALPLAIDAASVRLHWRHGTSGAFNEQLMSSTALPDSFAASVPEPPGGGDVQYWISAASESAAIAAVWPVQGAALPARWHAGADTSPPLVRHTSVPFKSRDRMPQALLARVTDNLGVDSVWCEYRIDAGALASVAATRAGRDSFVVSLGSTSMAVGQRIAYRFVARDASSAHLLGYSNAAFDTMRVTHDWDETFENPVSWFHQNGLYSWRDAWGVDTTRSLPAGGAAWHCGPSDGSAYAPHTDAVLYLPWIYSPGPGVTLSFDEYHDLESAGATRAWDAARVEASVNGGPWLPVTPTPGYTHTQAGSGMPFANGSPCWSGRSSGWVTRTLDLSSHAPGPAKLRMRMTADDLIGMGGWWIDRVRVHYPDETTLGVGEAVAGLSCGAPRPSPTRGDLRLPLSLPRRARVEWALHDVQGRRVAMLYDGTTEAGRLELLAEAPRALAAGLYFSRVRVDGHAVSAARVVVVR